MKHWLGIFLLLVTCNVANANSDLYPFTQPQQQQQFYDLLQHLRCLVCQNENLLDSNAKLAIDLRRTVYEKVTAGESSAAIENYLTQRYGDFVLLEPPLKRSTYVLWFLPFVTLLIGFYLLYRRESSN